MNVKYSMHVGEYFFQNKYQVLPFCFKILIVKKSWKQYFHLRNHKTIKTKHLFKAPWKKHHEN